MKGGNSLLIHRMHLDDHYVVLDVNSGAVHIIDKMIYDILGFYDGTTRKRQRPISRESTRTAMWKKSWRN